MTKHDELIARLIERAAMADSEGNATASADARHFRESVAAINDLKADAAALLEALREIVGHCGNDGYGNPIVNERIVDRCDETARAAITAWEVGE